MRHGNRWGRLCLSAVVGGTLVAQTKVDLGTQSRNIDFSGASFTKPFKSGTALPASCTVGETYFKTNATAGQNLYGCVATNTWLVLSGASATLPAVSGESGKVLSNNGSTTDWRTFGGDVSGNPEALAVGRLQGRIVSGIAPSNGQALVWNNSTSQWEPGTVSGGGGGSSTGAQLAAADYTPSRTSNTILTLPSVPVFTFRVGTAACANAIGSATVTISTGTGTVWIGLGGDCTVKARHNVVAACAAGCTAIGGASGFDPADLPLYEGTVSAGALAASGTRRLTPYASVPLVAGANVTLASSGGVVTISATGGGGGGGIAANSSLPATCTPGEYFSHSPTRSLWRCYQNNLPVLINWEPKDFVAVEEFTASSGDPSIYGDSRAVWYKDAGNVPVHTAGGTLPNFGTVAIATASSAGAQASVAWRGLGSPSGTSVPALAANFYMEATWKTSRSTDMKLFAGFQDGATSLLQYGERIGLRYEAAGSPGVYKFTAANSTTAYSSLSTVSTVTADANFHTVRVWRLGSTNFYMSVDGEAPVSFAGVTPANNGTLYMGVQTDSASPVTLTLDRTFLWVGVGR